VPGAERWALNPAAQLSTTLAIHGAKKVPSENTTSDHLAKGVLQLHKVAFCNSDRQQFTCQAIFGAQTAHWMFVSYEKPVQLALVGTEQVNRLRFRSFSLIYERRSPLFCSNISTDGFLGSSNITLLE